MFLCFWDFDKVDQRTILRLGAFATSRYMLWTGGRLYFSLMFLLVFAFKKLNAFGLATRDYRVIGACVMVHVFLIKNYSDCYVVLILWGVSCGLYIIFLWVCWTL